MLSKEEYKRALENMHSQVDIETQWYSYDILKKLIDEHFIENTLMAQYPIVHSKKTVSFQCNALIGMEVKDDGTQKSTDD